MAKVSVFAKLADNFRGLYKELKCSKCERKIDLQSKCTNCDAVFCTECRYQIKRTNACESCNLIDTVQTNKTNRNQFIDDLLDLIQMFDNDTGLKIVENRFLNVETADNLERLFEKDKNTVFNQQKFIATSTPNVNTKKVVFNSDITMITQNAKDAASKQLESVEKVNSKKKTTDKSLSNSKRKAVSMSEKSEDNSKTKKAKTLGTSSEEDEIAKENLNGANEILETDNQVANDKQNGQRKCTTLQNVNEEHNQERAKKNISIQNKQLEDQIKRLEEEKKLTEDRLKQLEQTNKQITDKMTLLEEQRLLMKNQNEKLEEQSKQFELERKKLEEMNRQLDGKIKLMEATKDLEEKSIQTIKAQMKEQMQEVNETLSKGISTINQAISTERMQEMIIAGLSRIVSNSERAVKSSIEFDKMGKINLTIEPFKEIEKEKVQTRDLEMQTEEKATGQIYVQTEATRQASQSSEAELDRSIDMKKSQSSQGVTDAVRHVVNVVDSSMRNGKQLSQGMEIELKPTNTTNNGNKSNNFSILFDDSVSKEMKKDVPVNQNGEDLIDSDELKKHVENDSEHSIFGSDSDIDEVGASSPIY